jgi:hypothetical protein
LSIPEERWNKLVSDFRRICLLRHQKRGTEAEMLLKNGLPARIAAWSESFEAELDVKRERLDAMFETEQRRIEDAFLVQELVAARFNEQCVPLICTQVAHEIHSLIDREIAMQDRRPNQPAGTLSNGAAPMSRVAFDNLPGVIDLVLAEDRIPKSAREFESSLVQKKLNQ